ncbi:GNAT family N-acetyltransferase [Deinococcus hopiensis]|uniref:GNAT family N-acetyltransferase n=1 Tax=Deinococcus hopiensis TaxID=309885 RepID=UPI003CCBFB07
MPALFLNHRTLSPADELAFIQQKSQAPGTRGWWRPPEHELLACLNFQRHRRPQLAHGGVLGMSAPPTHRGQGTGQRLPQQLFSWVDTKQHVSRVELQVFPNGPGATNRTKRWGSFIKAISSRPCLSAPPSSTGWIWPCSGRQSHPLISNADDAAPARGIPCAGR